MRRVHLARVHLEEVQTGRLALLPEGFANVDGVAGSASIQPSWSTDTGKNFPYRNGVSFDRILS